MTTLLETKTFKSAFQSITAIEKGPTSHSKIVRDIFPVGSHSALYASIQA